MWHILGKEVHLKNIEDNICVSFDEQTRDTPAHP